MKRITGFFVSLAYILHDALFSYMSSRGMILHASANTLTNLIPDLYKALDVVSREQIGFIPAVLRDSSAQSVAVGQDVVIPIVPTTGAVSITPGSTAPDTGGAAIGNTTMTVSKSKMVPIMWSGEEQLSMSSSGLMPSIQQQRFQQAFRTLANEVEADLAGLYLSASRAYGTAGTAPFGTAADLSDSAQTIRILEENGATMADVHAVLGAGAIANIRGKQSVLFKANEAGTDDLLRRGVIGDIHGVQIHNSGQVKTPTVGTGANYTTTAAGFAVGTTTIPLITGTGTVLAGDIVTFAGDSNKYVVATGLSAPGNLVLAEPGLRVAMSTATKAMTIVGAAERSMFFPRSAVALLTRNPAMPEGGDMADDVTSIVDPISGIAFQVCLYRQYRQIHIEIGLAWGVKAVKSAHMALLLG